MELLMAQTIQRLGAPTFRLTLTPKGRLRLGGIDGFLPIAATLSKPNATAAVSVGQINAGVLYEGTSFDGFFQVNAVIPQSLSPGSVPIALTVGGAASPT
jgi:uncharacterized protein (TIGR03437 family)